MGPQGAGAPGTGTVTSISVQSQSLANTTAPNPITTAGSIELELQVIPILRADLITALTNATLLPAVMYRITDPLAPLTAHYVLATRQMQIASTQWGRAGALDREVTVFWDWTIDQICEIYCPSRNNRTSRFNFFGTPYNCIENFDTTTNSFRNCWLTNCYYQDDATCFGDQIIQEDNSSLLLINGSFPDTFKLAGGAQSQVNNADPAKVEIGCISEVDFNGFVFEDIRVGMDEVLAFADVAVFGTKGATFESNNYDLNTIEATEAGVELIPYSYRSWNIIRVELSGNLTDFELQTPSKSWDGQIMEVVFYSDDFVTPYTVTNFQITTGDVIEYATQAAATGSTFRFRYNTSIFTWEAI